MKKIIFSIVVTLLILFSPMSVSALEVNYDLEHLYIDADVKENGDVFVKELIVLNGSFNGYYRDIIFGNLTNNIFTGSKTEFKGTADIYDAKGISEINVYSVNIDDKVNFDYIDNKDVLFSIVDTGSLGDSYVYEKTLNSMLLHLKMFKYTPTGSTGFYIEYTLEDAVVVHNDVAEFYWRFIGEAFVDDIEKLEIHINLPKKSSGLSVWAHGPLYGEVDLYEGEKVIAIVEDLPAETAVDIRMVFDKGIVNTGTKLSGVDGRATILEIEAERALEANEERETQALLLKIRNYLGYGWLIGLIPIFIYVYFVSDKERNPMQHIDYYRDFPAEYGPGVMGYLYNSKKINTNDFSASIFNLIYKKVFKLELVTEATKFKKANYKLIKTTKSIKLNPAEEHLIDWLINDIGDGKEVTFKEIERQSKTQSKAIKFTKNYETWKKIVKEMAEEQNFFEKKNKKSLLVPILYSVLGFGIGFYMLSMFHMMVAVGFIIYIVKHTKKTKKGIEQYTEWKGLRKFMVDFSNFNEKELPEIALWEKYLVYAVSFGIASKVEKLMKIKLTEMGQNINTMSFTYMHYSSMNMSNSLTNTLSKTVSSAVVSSRSSSSSGSGGGFSGGSSGGGGGGGGGGF